MTDTSDLPSHVLSAPSRWAESEARLTWTYVNDQTPLIQLVFTYE